MRQFFILFGFFMCSPVLADHGGYSGYSGKTFPCNNFNRARNSAKTHKTGGDYYNLGLCELHRGHLMPGIATLKQAASMGQPHAAIEVAEYYASDGYTLPEGETTNNEANLQKAIEYETQALQIIRQSNYPFNDPHGDYLRIEREDYPYLKTLVHLTGNYMNLYSARSIAHIGSKNQDMRGATLEPLRNAINAANVCLSVSYNSDIWREGVYNNAMALCRETKEFVQILLPLEEERLRVSKESCGRNTILSQCVAHNTVDSQIEQLYGGYLNRMARLLAAL